MWRRIASGSTCCDGGKRNRPRRRVASRFATRSPNLAADGRTADEMRTLIEALGIELVVTAHPTEAKRRSIRAKLRRISRLLSEFDQPGLLPRERTRLEDEIRAEVAKIWQTDFIRPWPPTVINEVQRGLSISPVLWKVVPEIMRDFREALAEQYPGETFSLLPFIRFASWIGGDRDGHPGVTADITRQTLAWLRKASVAQHRQACCDLYGSLSLSARQTPVSYRTEQRGRRGGTLLAGTVRDAGVDPTEREISALAHDHRLAVISVRRC